MITTFIVENWILFFGALTTVTAWVFGGKHRQFLDNKKSTEEIKSASATAMEGMQTVYDKYIEHDKVRTEKLELRIESLEKHNRTLQENFQSMSLSYALVTEQSKDWETKHNLLSKEYEVLKRDHDKLKSEFDKYKKENKTVLK